MAAGAFRQLASKLAQPNNVNVSKGQVAPHTRSPLIPVAKMTPQKQKQLMAPGNNTASPRSFYESPKRPPLSFKG